MKNMNSGEITACQGETSCYDYVSRADWGRWHLSHFCVKARPTRQAEHLANLQAEGLKASIKTTDYSNAPVTPLDVPRSGLENDEGIQPVSCNSEHPQACNLEPLPHGWSPTPGALLDSEVSGSHLY